MKKKLSDEERLVWLIKCSSFVMTGWFMMTLTAIAYAYFHNEQIATLFLFIATPLAGIGVISEYEKIKLKRRMGIY